MKINFPNYTTANPPSRRTWQSTSVSWRITTTYLIPKGSTRETVFSHLHFINFTVQLIDYNEIEISVNFCRCLRSTFLSPPALFVHKVTEGPLVRAIVTFHESIVRVAVPGAFILIIFNILLLSPSVISLEILQSAFQMIIPGIGRHRRR